MGFATEFNWFLVQKIEECDDIFGANIGDHCVMAKNEVRIYPIGALVPFIIKEIGCIGIVQIDDYDTNYEQTNISFHFVEKLNPKNPVAKHYWDMYMTMKELSSQKCKRTELLGKYELPSGPQLKYLETWN